MLYFLVGPSGVGKDSVLEEIKYRNITQNPPLIVADRFITRNVREGDDNHIAISEGSFKAKKSNHQFLFDWESHGFKYGIDIQALDYLEDGFNVIVNGSRAYITQAKNIVSDIEIIWLSVSQNVLRDRLFARARESEIEIEARLKRAQEMEKLKPKGCKTVYNDGPIENTVEQVLAWIKTNS